MTRESKSKKLDTHIDGDVSGDLNVAGRDINIVNIYQSSGLKEQGFTLLTSQYLAQI
jgi:hypothetical protein